MNPAIKYAFFDSGVDNKNCVRFKIKALIAHLLKFDAYEPWMTYSTLGAPKKISDPRDMYFFPWMLDVPSHNLYLSTYCEEKLFTLLDDVDLDREWIKYISEL